MEAAAHLTTLLTMLADRPVVLATAIVLATFVLEDLATVTVALLAAHMVIGGSLALGALVAGTVLGDLALYLGARLAGHTRLVRGMLAQPFVRPASAWLRRNGVGVVIVARFVPGLRLPVFAGAGSVRMPFDRFAVTIFLSTLVWTPGLFWAVRALGVQNPALSGGQSLGVLAGAVVLFIGVPRLVKALSRRALEKATATKTPGALPAAC